MRSILVICTLATLLLSGCASSGASTSAVRQSGPVYSQSALHVYNRSTDADHTLSIRTNALEANAPLIDGIKELCAKGVKVSVVLDMDGEQSASAVAGTCAEVYVSRYPEPQMPRIVMLADGILLSLNGELIAANNRDSEQENRFQRRQKSISRRIQ